MKKFLLNCVLVILALPSFAQNRFPNLDQDLTFDDPLWLSYNLNYTIPGYLALTGEAQYVKPGLVYGRAELGPAFVFASMKGAPEEVRSTRLKPYLDLEVGYPLPIATLGRGVKMILDSDSGYDMFGNYQIKKRFYRAKVPSHYLLTPTVGLALDPYPFETGRVPPQGAVFRVRAMAPSWKIGVSLMTFSRSKFSVKDSETGDVWRTSDEAKGQIKFFYKFPMRSSMVIDPSIRTIYAANPQWELIFDIPSHDDNGTGGYQFGLIGIPYFHSSSIVPNGQGTVQLFLAIDFTVENN